MRAVSECSKQSIAGWKLNYGHATVFLRVLSVLSLSDEGGWYKWYIYLIPAWSSVKDKLVFILVHDEVIIKLPQKRSGESSSKFLLSVSKQNNLVSDFIDCVWGNVSVFILSLNTPAGRSVLSFYHLIILVLVYIQEIVQDIGFQAEHVSCVRSDMNLVKYSAIFSTNRDYKGHILLQYLTES